MMAKMGYKEGHGLGKSEQGIIVPLLAKKTAGKAGIIVGGETKNTLMNSKSELPQSSTVILLLNMAAPGEVDKDLKIEIEDECNKKYGKVIKCIIYEEKEKNVPVEKAVRIFVKFENAEQSKKGM
jgi:splicing factor 45